MIQLDEALRRITTPVAPKATESVPLAAAAGRVLAEALHADRDHPAADRSAMDGFAVRADDLAHAPASLTVVGEVPAGAAPTVRVGRGEAARIFTGAVIPEGADSVVMVERTREDRDAGFVEVEISPPAGAHIRTRAQDREAGALLVEPGVVIEAAELATLASVGRTDVEVFQRPRVGVLSTGDEIVEPGETPAPHQVRNSNGPMLRQQSAAMGADARYLGIAGDDPAALEAALRDGLSGDVLLVAGGVSVGDYDLVGSTLEGLGLELWFHGVAMKPGKPVLAGRVDDCVVVGLPGNPVSAFAGFEILAAPMLRKLSGLRRVENAVVEATLTAPLRCRAGRTTFHLVTLRPAATGLSATPVASTGSGDVLAMTAANGFAVTAPESTGAGVGDLVRTLPWNGFLDRGPGGDAG